MQNFGLDPATRLAPKNGATEPAPYFELSLGVVRTEILPLHMYLRDENAYYCTNFQLISPNFKKLHIVCLVQVRHASTLSLCSSCELGLCIRAVVVGLELHDIRSTSTTRGFSRRVSVMCIKTYSDVTDITAEIIC